MTLDVVADADEVLTLASVGLPTSFASSKVRIEKNRKKREQKKKSRLARRKNSKKINQPPCDHFNYAEEFKLNEILREYRKEFTILMSKDDRMKKCIEDEEEKEVEEEYVVYENERNEYAEEIHFSYDPEEHVQEQDQTLFETSTTSACTSVTTSTPSTSTSTLHKYYQQRYDYFHKFDEGIMIDEEGWYSVTPEFIAEHIAKEAHSIASTYMSGEKDTFSTELVLLDAFCGVGGNTIQFAKYFDKVLAVDLNAERLEMARHNATIYGVADKIEFIHGDVFTVLPALGRKVDFVFMSPPWGGPDYVTQTLFCPDRDILEGRGAELFYLARSLCKNVILFLPRQTNIFSIAKTLKNEPEKDKTTDDDDEESFVVEQDWLRNRLKAISVYFFP